MTSFGLRETTLAAVAPSVAASVHLILAAFAVPATLTALYVWFYILKMPLERPIGPLFGNGPAPREGRAAWDVARPVAFALPYAVFWLYFRRTHRWTVLGFVLAGALAIVLGGTGGFWGKHIGYTWY